MSGGFSTPCTVGLVIGSSEGEDSHSQEGIVLTQKKKIAKMVFAAGAVSVHQSCGLWVFCNANNGGVLKLVQSGAAITV